jgi:hypothetical protein
MSVGGEIPPMQVAGIIAPGWGGCVAAAVQSRDICDSLVMRGTPGKGEMFLNEIKPGSNYSALARMSLRGAVPAAGSGQVLPRSSALPKRLLRRKITASQ